MSELITATEAAWHLVGWLARPSPAGEAWFTETENDPAASLYRRVNERTSARCGNGVALTGELYHTEHHTRHGLTVANDLGVHEATISRILARARKGRAE